MAERFDWAPRWAQMRLRIALGVAVMRAWVGLIVLLAGIGLALLNFQPPQPPDPDDQANLGYDSLRTFSARGGAAGGPASSAKVKVERRTAAAENSVQPTATSWERGTAVAPNANAQAATTRTRIAPEKPEQAPVVLSGYELTRALQKELQRVGCYHGEIDGDWGPGSKRAMSGFTDRVNASLPIDTPDHILLRMVQGYVGEACGSCRPGESRNSADRCVPTAVLAHAAGEPRGGNSRAPRIETTWETRLNEQRTREPLPGRMSVGAAIEDADSPVPVTQEATNDPERSSRRSHKPARRARVAEQRARSYQWTPPPRTRHWTQTIFDDIARR